MKNRKIILVIMISLLAAHFLIYGCGTKTKNKTQDITEIKSNEKSEIEEKKKIFDSIKTALLEEAKREFSEIAKENSTEEATKKTIIESKETIFDDYRSVPNTGLSIQDRTGRIIETRTIIQEKSKIEKQKETEIKKIEQERKTKDCLAVIKISETKLSLLEKKIDLRLDKLEKQSETKGWKPGFWFYFWIFLILFLIILFFYLYRKFGNPIGWWSLLIGFFKRKKATE